MLEQIRDSGAKSPTCEDSFLPPLDLSIYTYTSSQPIPDKSSVHSSTCTQYRDYLSFQRTNNSTSSAETQRLFHQSPHQGGVIADRTLPQQSSDFISLAEQPSSSNYPPANPHHTSEGDPSLLSPYPPYLSAIKAEEGMRGMIPMQRFQASSSSYQHFELASHPQGHLTQQPTVPNTSLVPAHRDSQRHSHFGQNRHRHYDREHRRQSPQTPNHWDYSSSATQSSLLSAPSSTASSSTVDPGIVTHDENDFFGFGAQFPPYTGQEYEQMSSLDKVGHET
ncbi:hypothetical protein B7494_g556 [Chlorociboria aeruginascens]|nr:hypothetical protein B7494_g556 [Chlorociboria aeruginascens]